MNRRELLYAVGTLASLFIPTFIAIAFVMSGKWREAQERERARRMAEHRMNARLLRFNI